MPVPPREIELALERKQRFEANPAKHQEAITRRRNGLEILRRRHYDGNPTRFKALEEARANEEIARTIRKLREAAALTQAQLAKLASTTASVICRLEDADHEGQSLALLHRIANVLNRRVEIRYLPIQRSA